MRRWYIGFRLGYLGRRRFRKYLPDKKVNAIKSVRADTGAGLKEAKDYVDAYYARRYG